MTSPPDQDSIGAGPAAPPPAGATGVELSSYRAADIQPGQFRRGARIGLLGGSFNPAHGAHRQISLAALGRLGLDEVWWLVSPQNPLKPVAGMASFAERLAGARAIARHPKIRVTGIEHRLGTVYTAETVLALKRRFPSICFVWLMGADNLIQIDQWKDWQRIFNAVPVAVFARPSYCFRALAARAAHRFARARLPEGKAGTLVRRRHPAWVFIHGRLNPLSASAIRAGRAESGAAGTAPGGKRKD